MEERKFVRVLSRSAVEQSEALTRLVGHRDRVVAMLRASRKRPASPMLGRMSYRSQYAATLWAMAYAEPEEARPHLRLVEA